MGIRSYRYEQNMKCFNEPISTLNYKVLADYAYKYHMNDLIMLTKHDELTAEDFYCDPIKGSGFTNG